MVQPGDTLYSIALRFEKDFQELARVNSLDARYTIRPGQRLRLRDTSPVAARSTARPASRPTPKPATVAAPRPAATAAASRPSPLATAAGTAAPAGGTNTPSGPVTKKPALPTTGSSPEVRDSSPVSTTLTWAWPAKGPLIGRFGGAGVTGKGLDIAGKRGDSVFAAAPGVVVYAGSALVGYGRLLIIRHDDNYISAYAHNDRFLVGEGERVRPGQVIAEMGASGADREKLHFEIRERGKPVDPLRFLPARE